MKSLLYIKASPRTERSHSIAVTDAFVNEYLGHNPAYRVRQIDLFDENLPQFALPEVNAKYKIIHQQEHTPAEAQTWQKVLDIIEDFKNADKYAFAVPMWNFSIPYRLKQYIDLIVQPGQTFTIDKQGKYIGLITGKPAFIAFARGGAYDTPDSSPLDMQIAYLFQILRFIGFKEIRSLTIEPTLALGPDVTKKKQAQAIEYAKRLAVDF
jgi:FMN-dependent NADH-azoreductase